MNYFEQTRKTNKIKTFSKNMSINRLVSVQKYTDSCCDLHYPTCKREKYVMNMQNKDLLTNTQVLKVRKKKANT